MDPTGHSPTTVSTAEGVGADGADEAPNDYYHCVIDYTNGRSTGLGCDILFPGQFVPNAQPLSQREAIAQYSLLTVGEAGTVVGVSKFLVSVGGQVTGGAVSAFLTGFGKTDFVRPNINDGSYLTQSNVLPLAEKWLGEGYTEIDTGVYLSKDGTRRFRMTDADIMDTKSKHGPHVHFEVLDSAGKVIENSHVTLYP